MGSFNYSTSKYNEMYKNINPEKNMTLFKLTRLFIDGKSNEINSLVSINISSDENNSIFEYEIVGILRMNILDSRSYFKKIKNFILTTYDMNEKIMKKEILSVDYIGFHTEISKIKTGENQRTTKIRFSIKENEVVNNEFNIDDLKSKLREIAINRILL